MPLLVAMSLFGSLGTLIYAILLPITRKCFPVTWRRNYLICVIFEYLIPFPYFSVNYGEFLSTVFSDFVPHKVSSPMVYIDDTVDIIQIGAGHVAVSNSAAYIFAAIVIFVGLILYGFQIYRYMVVRYYIRYSVNEVEDQKITRVIHDCVADFKMTERVRVYRCKFMDSPFTIGIIRPIVVLPDDEWSESDLALAMKHELTHIRHHDNLIKMVVLGVIALNFYNPFAYFVLLEWNNVAEQACDREVVMGLTDEEAHQYGMLIIRIAEKREDDDNSPVMGFNLQKELMKARMYQMKFGVKKESLVRKVLGACLMGVVLISSSMSVLAYSPKNVIYHDNLVDEFIFCEEGVTSWGDTYGEFDASETIEWIFTSDDGEIVEVLDEEDLISETNIFCNHTYVSGELAMHTRNSNGGCTIEYYDAQRCSKCGHYIVGDWKNTVTFAKCTH